MDAVAGEFQKRFSELDDDAMFAVSHAAAQEVYTRAQPIARKLAARACKKYDWVNVDDLTQNLMLEIPRFMFAYDPHSPSKTSWSKYLFHKLYFYVKDLLRKEDPLGVKWPQKKVYPKWHRLADEALDGFEVVDLSVLADDDAEPDLLMDEIKAWREYFSQLPKLPKEKQGKKSASKSAAGLIKKRKRANRGGSHGLWSWWQQRERARLEREKPKQLALWGE